MVEIRDLRDDETEFLEDMLYAAIAWSATRELPPKDQSIGSALMRAIHDRARAQGTASMSLSVDADNPAKRLYLRLGYVDVEGDEHGKMILALA